MIYVVWVLVVMFLPFSAQAGMDRASLRNALDRLHSERAWGEAVLVDGRTRQIQIDSLGTDSVFVREVIGPLQERRAGYALREFDSLRELGVHRIPSGSPPDQASASMAKALLLEAAIPGGGYFYIGETGKGLTLIGLAAAAVGTGIATGKEGAAGWAPISAWIKVAALFNLRDEVRAIEQSGKIGGARSGGGASPSPGHYLRNLEIGRMQGRKGAVPAVRVHTDF